MVETQKKLFNKRRSNDIFNATQNDGKKERENLWRKSVYVEPGIAGSNGYPAIEIPSDEIKHKQKLEKQKNYQGNLDGQVDHKLRLSNIFAEDMHKTTNQFFNSKFSLASKPASIVDFSQVERTQSDFAKRQVSEALKISMDIQQKKKELQ